MGENSIQVIDPAQYPGWDDLILSHPDASVFHSSAWAEVLQKSYGYTPLYFTVFEDRRIAALVPMMEVRSLLTGRRGVSLPFTDYCDSIVSSKISFSEVFDSVRTLGKDRGWRIIELRGGRGRVQEAPPSGTFLVHSLDLRRGEEIVFSGLRDSTRRGIKRAMGAGVKVTVGRSAEEVETFCGLNSLTRRRHGLPPQPLHFFRNLCDRMISRGFGFVVTAIFSGVPVAGAVYLTFGQKAVYKYGASDLKYQHVRANNLVMWEAVKRCCQDGFKELSFGRTELENQGLIQFKSGWGTTEHQIHYYRYDLRKDAFVNGSSRVDGFHNQIFRRMPIPVLNKVGALLYRHVA